MSPRIQERVLGLTAAELRVEVEVWREIAVAATEDAGRLDWLERQAFEPRPAGQVPRIGHVAIGGEMLGRSIAIGVGGQFISRASTLRDAIDTAILEAKPKRRPSEKAAVENPAALSALDSLTTETEK